ncbi:hypothetical protein JQ615_01110 [Bradyrhizobium jicamae]|uniref:Uncharacterized protein n=1 Tax=Bradyrhizobium jicamae TaxID=280332 RepID=A0ABS5FB20_9BRAD|nr:hypothetical protein [Bradyrhizobium jicamae]MBR0793980.1 hypothetical protein [Bradyrhizobium jicamae]
MAIEYDFDAPDVRLLISIVGAALQTPRPVPAREQNEEVARIYSAAHNLRTALSDGFLALEQSAGSKWGEVVAIGGSDDERHWFLRRFGDDLDRLIDLADQSPEPTRNGKPEDIARTIAMARCVAWHERQCGSVPPRSKESKFMEFASEVFRHANPHHDVADLSAHLSRALRLRKGGANLETWIG